MYMFSTTPKDTVPPPPGLVPSNLVWDKIAKEYVDTPSSYYYETRHPTDTAYFNNIGGSQQSTTVSDSNPMSPLALMKAMASSVPPASQEVVSQKASGPMCTILKTDDGRPILMVIDSGTHIAVVPQSVILGCLKINHASDITLTSTDDMFTDPLGICDDFKFRIGNVLYSTQVYVAHKASLQLLLGTEFIWKAGIRLFPRWGAIVLSLSEFQVIQGTCECITADKAPPSLIPVLSSGQSVSVPASSPVPMMSSPFSPPATSLDVDPLSGIPLEIPRQDARFPSIRENQLFLC
jgi:hypothetical protein